MMIRINKMVSLFTALLLSSAAMVAAATLDECIATALQQNPDAQSASRRVAAAKAGIQEAQSGFYPQLTLSGAYTRSDNPPQAFFMSMNQRSANMQTDINNPDDTENLRLSAGAKMRLLDGGQRSLGIQAARLGTEATRQSLEAVQNDLIYQVTRGFYGVLQARRFVQVLEETVSSLNESLRVANERFKAGSTVQTDVLSLEVKLAEAQDDLIRAKNGLLLAIAALNTAIGEDLVSNESIADIAPESLTAPVKADADDSLSDRPEMRAAHFNTEIKEKMWKISSREKFPVLSAFGSVDWDSDVSSDFQNSYFAGAMAEWDIFTGFRKNASAAKARAEYEAAKADEESARQKLGLDLKQALIKTGEAWDRMDVTRKSLESAEEALRITQEQYRQGAADITILLNSQVGLTAVRTRHIAAQYDYLTAQANLKRARGQLTKQFVKSTNTGEGE
ncbi:MAG: TolC family protein [Lentisphaerota bacterium]